MLLSLTMIVKNEADCLERCLASVHELVDEIVVVDTGSTDRTPEIAASYGARLFFHPWTDDFSAARNFALEQAQGQWILVLDADEVLHHPGREQVSAFLAAAGAYAGFYLHIINQLDLNHQHLHSQDQVVRLFRNRSDFRFSGAIHEQIAPSILATAGAQSLGQAPFTIHHYGYLPDAIQKKQKCQRNLQVIRQALAQNGPDPFLYYSLGCEYLTAGEPSTALHWFERALALCPETAGYHPDLSLRAGYCHFLLRQWEQVEQLARLAPRLYLLLASAEQESGNFERAERLFLQAASSCPEAQAQIEQARGEIALARQQPEQACQHYLAAIQSRPAYLFPLLRLLEVGQRHPALRQESWVGLYPPALCRKFYLTLDQRTDRRLVQYFLCALAYQQAEAILRELSLPAASYLQACYWLALAACYDPIRRWPRLLNFFWKDELP